MQTTIRLIASAAALAAVLVSTELSAADEWIEVKSANFSAISNAGQRGTQTLLWQLEQMRRAMTALWAWMTPDLNKPLSVIIVKDANTMRMLAPRYWQPRGGGPVAALWATGPDQHYLVLRSDVKAEDKDLTNPYFTSYFSYVGLVLDQSLGRELPHWFKRGFTGVLGNTIVREDRILLGPVIPWMLRNLREHPPMPLAKLLTVAQAAPEFQQGSFHEDYDAQTWAFVHFLLFADEGKRRPPLDAFLRLVGSGKEPAIAFAEALGPLEPIQAAFTNYLRQFIFLYQRFAVDMSVQRELFPVRPLTVADAAGAQAQFHATMGQPTESRASIAAARKADPNRPASYVAEALLLDMENRPAEAKTAYAKAVELETTSAFPYYRLAVLSQEQSPSEASLKQVDALLSKAVARNPRYADAFSWLGEVRARLGSPVGIGLILRGISLEPREPRHRLRAAFALVGQGMLAEARTHAEAALALADDPVVKRQAEEILDLIAKRLKNVRAD